MKIPYKSWRPRADALAVIEQAELICSEYAAQGYDLTLRQLYYQFVARGLIPNNMKSYKKLGDIVGDARLAGLLDWSYIVDRTRNLRGLPHWDSPSSIIHSAARSFRLDKWADQPYRVEVWVEKEALAGVVERAANAHDVDWFSCRGYVSLSEQYSAGRRIKNYILDGQSVVILHLGDHDPSGIDMTRDIRDRLSMFIGYPYNASGGLEVRRIALNYDQVQRYNPPPNPAKLTDSRANAYVAEHGYESWELDALDPATLNDLISEHIDGMKDPDLFAAKEREEQRHRELLSTASARWDDVVNMLEND